MGNAPFCLERNELFLRSNEGCEHKAQERTVDMRFGDNKFTLLVHGVHRIRVSVEQVVQVLLWRCPYQEHHQHEPANYFYHLFPHRFAPLFWGIVVVFLPASRTPRRLGITFSLRLAASIAIAIYHHLRSSSLKARRQFYRGRFHGVQAKHFIAGFAMKMNMAVVVVSVRAIIPAKCKPGNPIKIDYFMHDARVFKIFEHTV